METDLNLNGFSLPSPAKVNHFLHINGRRPDGYHLLQTLFQFLDYGDMLHFERRQDSNIVLQPNNMLDIPNQTNLIYRAAKALQLAAGVKQGVTILAEKQLPLGAGLGGGSSNAATTLHALNWLWQLNWSLAELLQIGVTLGADVPIFLYGHAAWAAGIGEQLTAALLPEPWIVVVLPQCQVATAKMYADPNLTRDTPTLRIGALAKDEIELFIREQRNDFEPLARKYYPEVDDAMKWLSNFGTARLSGSGASVFACFASQAQAKNVAEQIPKRFKGFLAKGTNGSPLKLAAESLGFTCNDWGVAKR